LDSDDFNEEEDADFAEAKEATAAEDEDNEEEEAKDEGDETDAAAAPANAAEADLIAGIREIGGRDAAIEAEEDDEHRADFSLDVIGVGCVRRNCSNHVCNEEGVRPDHSRSALAMTSGE
jgi:hypothetical protein